MTPPAREWPPYAFVPGRQPHPVRDPRGHSHDRPKPSPPDDPADPAFRAEFRWGVELFDRGYYWEAHEAWETLWQTVAKPCAWADFLKGLIKLAATGVKSREGNATGVARHARRAAELLRSCRELPDAPLPIDELVAVADALAVNPPVDTDPVAGGKPVLGVKLADRPM
jgi:hypothetical protein